jgi:hypothetical protein
MKANLIVALALTCLCCCSVTALKAQQDTTMYRIETVDGNEYIGTIVTQDAEKLTLKTERMGEITLFKIDIKKMTVVNVTQMKGGTYWFENPQTTRYFWQPSAYGLKKGEGYYQNVWILFNQVSVGVTDNFSIGAGIVPLFLFAGGSTPVWIAPKFSIPLKKDRLNLGTGALMGTVLGEEDTSFGIAYGTITVGSRDKNFSLGLGYGYAGGDWADAPTITFSAMIRTGQRSYFMTENYYIGSNEEDVMLFFIGGRRLIKNSGIDFGLVVPTDTGGDLIAIPWLGVTFPFGNAVRSRQQPQRN